MTHRICSRLHLAMVVVIMLIICTMAQFVMAQDIPDTLITVNMTGMDDSLLTIGLEGVEDSRLILNTPRLTINLTGVHLYPISCSFGLLRPGDIRTTDSAFTIYNTTNVTVSVEVGVSGDWIGPGDWTHSDDCAPGVNTAGLRAIVEDDNGHTSIIVRKTEPYNYLVTNLAPGERRSFALEIYAPTEFSEYSQKENDIFITVSEA